MLLNIHLDGAIRGEPRKCAINDEDTDCKYNIYWMLPKTLDNIKATEYLCTAMRCRINFHPPPATLTLSALLQFSLK